MSTRVEAMSRGQLEAELLEARAEIAYLRAGQESGSTWEELPEDVREAYRSEVQADPLHENPHG